MKEEYKTLIKELHTGGMKYTDIRDELGVSLGTIHYTIKGRELFKAKAREYQPKKKAPKNVLVIGDLHEPFTLDGYLEWNKELYKKYKCDHVIFAGDIIDNHYSSFHDGDPDGMGGKEELEQAIKKLSKWHEAFPNADVCIGNHDKIPFRKGFAGGLPKAWIKEYKEVLGTPTWNFQERFVYDDVQYVHGTGQQCRQRAKNDLMSTVQGHYHSFSYVEHYVGANFKVFGLQIGCGIDSSSYAAAYGKHFKKQAIGSGVVLDNGRLPISLLMEL